MKRCLCCSTLCKPRLPPPNAKGAAVGVSISLNILNKSKTKSCKVLRLRPPRTETFAAKQIRVAFFIRLTSMPPWLPPSLPACLPACLPAVRARQQAGKQCLLSREDNYDNDDNSFCVCSAHMLATLVYSFELFPKAHLILIMRDNASYKMLLPRPHHQLPRPHFIRSHCWQD